MLPLTQFQQKKVQIVFTDIDDTLTDSGKLAANAYTALWQLFESGIKVIPVTGRPAGWCEMIARLWPVRAVVGENGAFYFMHKNNKMQRHFALPSLVRKESRRNLRTLGKEILLKVPGTAIASDQFSRLFDLAIDFCEDVPALPLSKAQEIKKIFESKGATAKLSSIHVNGWFGDFDKLSMCKIFAERELGLSAAKLNDVAAFIGDSPNDEPMFQFFNNSFGVANVKKFSGQMKFLPQFVSPSEGGSGFAEIANKLIELS
ncbi:MAG: HAD-IIB family hydrolase [Pseudomonadota bacterium]|nr:HAD-IIB family hydrolase [Pseudomonadota bacterium]